MDRHHHRNGRAEHWTRGGRAVVDVRARSSGARAAKPRVPDEIEAGGQHFLPDRAAFLARTRADLYYTHVVAFSESSDESPDLTRDAALRLAEVSCIDCGSQNASVAWFFRHPFAPGGAFSSCAAVIAAPAQRKKR